MSCITASVRPVIGVPGAGKVFTCFAGKVAARARWLVVNSVAASSTSIKCGGARPPLCVSLSPESLYVGSPGSPPRARCVYALVL